MVNGKMVNAKRVILICTFSSLSSLSPAWQGFYIYRKMAICNEKRKICTI